MDEFGKEHAIETFRSLITIAVAALQTLVLLNGGALVALLAFLGQLENRAEFAGRVGRPVAYFIAGLVLAAAAFIAAYVTQLFLYGESVLGGDKRHHISLWITALTAIASLVLFAFGAYTGALALTTPNPEPLVIGIP